MGMPKVDLWGDGSTYPANPGRRGWGTILVFNSRTRVLSGYLPKATNNQMEVLAVIGGLEKLALPCQVTVYTDSAYVIHGIQAALQQRTLQSNTDLWERITPLLRNHTLRLCKVKAHDGILLNEWANDLAAEAAIHYHEIDAYVETIPETYAQRAARKQIEKARRSEKLAL